jgi:hypothetical protein
VKLTAKAQRAQSLNYFLLSAERAESKKKFPLPDMAIAGIPVIHLGDKRVF